MSAVLRLVLTLALGAPVPGFGALHAATGSRSIAGPRTTAGPHAAWRAREPLPTPAPPRAPGADRHAQEPVRLTLEEALRRAREAAPRLAELAARSRADRARLDRAEAGRLPRIGARGGYTRQSNVPELLIERGGELQPIFPNIPDNWRLELAVDARLYTGGRIEAEREAAARALDAREHEIEAATEGIDLAVTAAYWELVLTRDRERILSSSIRSFDAHVEDARNRLEVGLAAPDEPLAVEVERDRAELRRLEAGRDAEVARDRLALLLGLPPGAPLEPVASIDGTGARPQSLEGSLEDLTAAALESRPERNALARRVEAARARVRAVSAGDLPQVSAAAGFQYANPNRRILPPEAGFQDSWNVSVDVLYNLFDGGRRDADVTAALAEVDALRQQLAGLDRDIRLEVIREYRDIETSIAAVEVARRAVVSARESLRVATDRYREGLIPSSRRLDAEVAELQAGLDLSEALIRVRLARARLERAVGR